MFWSESWTHTVSRYKYAKWREYLNSWIGLPGWFWMPFLAIMVGLAGSGAFLYLRNHFATHANNTNRLAIWGLFFPNVFFFQFWTPLMLWGPMYWWGAALDSLFIFGTGLAIVILMGIEGSYLPMGLWIGYTFCAGVVMIATLVFWWYGNEVAVAMERWASKLTGPIARLGHGWSVGGGEGTPGRGIIPPGILGPHPEPGFGAPPEPGYEQLGGNRFPASYAGRSARASGGYY